MGEGVAKNVIIRHMGGGFKINKKKSYDIWTFPNNAKPKNSESNDKLIGSINSKDSPLDPKIVIF